MSKRIAIALGSPRRAKSISRMAALYFARFLDFDYEVVDLARLKLPASPDEPCAPGLDAALEKLRASDAVVWAFGGWTWFVPHPIHRLFERLFATDGPSFEGKLAAAVMTSGGVGDDTMLARLRFACEQLGFGYLGDVSGVASPIVGYEGDTAEAFEASCRVLAGQLNRALEKGFVPSKAHDPVERRFLSPLCRGHAFPVDGPSARKTGKRTIMVVTGNRLSDDASATGLVESLRRYSVNSVEVVELADRTVRPCSGCFLCAFREAGVCVIKDDFDAIYRRLHEVDGIVYAGTSSCGLVDARIKVFLDRCWGIAHRPSLGGKHGMTFASGGGPLDLGSASYLHAILTKTGTRCLPAISQGSADATSFAATVRQAVEDLDRAMEEGWPNLERHDARAQRWAFRDVAAARGMVLKADYTFHRRNRMFDAPSPGGGNAILRWMFTSDALQKKMLKKVVSEGEQAREKRLADYLARGGTLGKGKDLGSPLAGEAEED
jgi:multimeric flavodoxin WrbA